MNFISIDYSETVAPGVISRPNWHTALLFCGILGPVFFLIVYFVFGDISPDFDMLKQPIGHLQLLNYGWIQSLNFAIFSGFTCLFAIGLHIELQNGRFSITLPLIHFAIAAGLVLLAIFPVEPTHTYASVAFFVPLTISFWIFALRFKNDPEWKGWTMYSNLCGLTITMLLWCFYYAIKIDSPYAGVFEHLIWLVRMVWLVAFTLNLLWGKGLHMNENAEAINK